MLHTLKQQTDGNPHQEETATGRGLEWVMCDVVLYIVQYYNPGIGSSNI